MASSPPETAEGAAGPGASGLRKLSGDAAVYIGASIIGAIVPFLILPLMTRWLGPADYGVVAGYLALVNVAILLVGLSTHGIVSVVYYRDGPGRMPPQVGACFGVLAMMSLPVLLGLYGGAGLIENRIGVSREWLWTVWMAACGQFIALIAMAVWQTLRMPFRFAMTQLGFSLTTAITSVWLVGVSGFGWEGRALGQAAGGGAIALACALTLTVTRNVNWSPVARNMRSTLQFGIGLLPHAAGAVTMASVDRFALGAYTSNATTGQYFAAFQIASIITAVAAAFNAAWNPWLYERLARDTPAAKRQVVIGTYGVGGLFIAGALVMALFGPLIVRIVAGPGYEMAGELLRILAPAAAFGACYYLVSGYYFYTERTGRLSIVTTTIAAVQIGLSFWLGSVAGANGVAVATLVSGGMYFFIAWATAQRIAPMPWMLRGGAA